MVVLGSTVYNNSYKCLFPLQVETIRQKLTVQLILAR